MWKAVRAIASVIVYLLGLALWFLDQAGRGLAFRDLKEMFPRVVEFLLKHQEFAYQIAPWVLMIVPIIFLVILQWPGLLIFWRKKKPTQITPTTLEENSLRTAIHSTPSTAALSALPLKNYAAIEFDAAKQMV